MEQEATTSWQVDELWHLLRERGLSMEFNLTLTKARLKEALERVELIH